jgi:hypothetical protein
MSIEIKDAHVIFNLLQFYYNDISKGVMNPRTGALYIPPETDLKARLDLLNLGLFNPDVVLVWGADLAYTQLDIWAPILKKTKLKHAVFCKSLKGKNQSHAKLDNVPIYGIKEGVDTKFIGNIAENLSCMLYMTDKNDNFGYYRAYPHLLHVAAHHGDSDKHSSFNRLFGAYDYMIVADRNSMQRYMNVNTQLPPDQFITIGNSVIEGVTNERRSVIQNVLFAPTFEGYSDSANFSSLKRIGDEIIKLKKSGFNLLFRPHPGTGKRITSLKEISKKIMPLAESVSKKEQQFNQSDVLVCDLSGVLSEYIFTEKPIIIPISKQDGWLYEYVHNTNVATYAYLWDKNEISLAEFIRKIEQNDYLQQARTKRKNELFCGVNSLTDSIQLYEKAIHLFKNVKYFRDIKIKKYQQESIRFSQDPSDPELKKIVQQIRNGHAVLQLAE